MPIFRELLQRWVYLNEICQTRWDSHRGNGHREHAAEWKFRVHRLHRFGQFEHFVIVRLHALNDLLIFGFVNDHADDATAFFNGRLMLSKVGLWMHKISPYLSGIVVVNANGRMARTVMQKVLEDVCCLRIISLLEFVDNGEQFERWPSEIYFDGREKSRDLQQPNHRQNE